MKHSKAKAARKRKPRSAATPSVAAPSGIFEANDDPHRLARPVTRRFTHADSPRLRRWNDQWYEWIAGAYRVVPDGELRAQITSSIKDEFDRLGWQAVARWKERDKGDPPPVVQRVTGRLTADV